MSFPEPPEPRNIGNIFLYAFPISMLVSIIFWFFTTYLKSERRKKRKERKKFIKKKKQENSAKIKIVNYIKSQKLGEYLKDGFAYCDYCGKKLHIGELHDTQKCLINKYSHVVIE